MKPGDVVKFTTENGRVCKGLVVRVYPTCVELVPDFWWDYPAAVKPTQGVPLAYVL